MLVSNPINTIFIPPAQTMYNQPNLLQSRQNGTSSNKKLGDKERQTNGLTDEVGSDANGVETTAVQDERAASAAEIEEMDRQAALERERRQLELIQAATANLQQQTVEEESAASMREILRKVTDSIQQLIDVMEHDDAQSQKANAAPVIPNTIPYVEPEYTDEHSQAAEELKNQHIEDLMQFLKRSAEIAYHVRQPQQARPDVIPVVTPLHHEDEYV